jgi:TonB family protein
LDSPSLTQNLRLKKLQPGKKPKPQNKQTPLSKTPLPIETPIALPSKPQTKALYPVKGWNQKPPYPSRAIRLGQEGSVHLELQIDSRGKVASLRILKGSGSPLLDLVSRKTLARWRYDGGPGKVREKVVFRLIGAGMGGVEIVNPQEGRSSPNPRSRK